MLLLFSSTTLFAQRPMPARGSASATLNGKKISIDYGRPELKGRSLSDLMGQLSEDRVWRAGTNQVTTLTTEGPLVIGGKTVPAGKYSLYVHIPESEDWSLLVNRDPGVELIKIFPKAPPQLAHALWPHLDGYDKISKEEVARAAMKKGNAGAQVDAFTIDLKATGGSCTLTMSWGDQVWSAEIKAAK